MRMPEMEGQQAMREARKLPGWQAVPIVALTAEAFEECLKGCEVTGMDDLVARPIAMRTLHAALENG